MTQYEREEEQLADDLRTGRISQAEYNQQAREMERDYRNELRGMAEDAAERAYNDIMGGW